MKDINIIITQQVKELTSNIKEDEGYIIQINNAEILNAFTNTKISTYCTHEDYKGMHIVTKGRFNMQCNIALIIAIYKEIGRMCDCQQYGSNIVVNLNTNIPEAEVEIYPEGCNILYKIRRQYAHSIIIENIYNR